MKKTPPLFVSLVDLSVNSERTAEEIIFFIRKILKETGFSKVLLALSGGVDSATSCFLAAKALGARNVHVVLFAHDSLDKESVKDAILVADKLDIPLSNRCKIDIKSAVRAILRCASFINTNFNAGVNKLRIGNVIARVRMVLLYDMAKKYNALVLGTENKSEHLLGYFTRFGDEASDIEPIRHLYKTQVRQLAAYLGVPEKIIAKPPSAGLWKGQVDEKELGFTYRAADQILYLYHDEKKSRGEIIKKGFARVAVDKVLRRFESNLFKRITPYVFQPPQPSVNLNLNHLGGDFLLTPR